MAIPAGWSGFICYRLIKSIIIMTIVLKKETKRVNGKTYTLQQEATSPDYTPKWYLTINGRPKKGMQGMIEKPSLEDYISKHG